VAVRYFCDRCDGEVCNFGHLKVIKVVIAETYGVVRPDAAGVERCQVELCGGCREAFLEVVRAFVAGKPAAEQAEQVRRAVKVQKEK
jgi:hypothetical protein